MNDRSCFNRASRVLSLFADRLPWSRKAYTHLHKHRRSQHFFIKSGMATVYDVLSRNGWVASSIS